ncbi:MAG: DUF169 domain-containing protein [Vicinamibacterales bacterium]
MSFSSEALGAVSRMNLQRVPVAVAFLADPPAGLPHVDRALPAGCSYWKHASDGHAFYTLSADHENCPIGAFTHGVTLAPAKAQELQSLVGMMIELQYLRSDEVAGIPHRAEPMQCVAYAPLDRASFTPDVVIVCGNVRQIMLVAEAARAAGVHEGGAAMGRPACAMLPQAMSASASVTSLGCIGNRVYTGLADDELYFAIPGGAAARVFEKLDVVLTANTTLEAFHQQRATAV